MPKTKFQEVIFTIMMVFVMVYAMICYNIALNVGGLNTSVFLSAFHEFVIMAPVAFVLDFFFVGHIAKRTAFRIVNPEKENPFHLVVAISVVTFRWRSSGRCYMPDRLYAFCSDRYSAKEKKLLQQKNASPDLERFFYIDFFCIFFRSLSSRKNPVISALHSSSSTPVVSSA